MRNQIKIFFFTLLLLIVNFVKSQPGCPNIDAGADQTLNCTTTCTNITANAFATGASTSYAVTNIPYNPPNPYNSGTPILINIDDRWSDPINLPFTFCFFGNLYDQVLIGSNQIISFDLTNAGLTCPYQLYTGSTIPTSTYPTNSIMGPYQDIDPTYQGAIYWQLIGTYPCRILIVSFYQIPYFGDPNSIGAGSGCPNPLFATSQIVLYESTSVIEIYIQKKDICSGWQGGLAIEGIQDPTGTIAYSVPGRNCTAWSATNDAWRFTPNDVPNYTVSWWQGGNQISTNPTINVCPTSATTYTAKVVYDCCAGNQVTLTDDVVINVDNSIGLSISPANPLICGGGNATLTASSTNPNATYHWSNGSTNAVITVNPTSTTTYSVTATTTGCSTQASVDVIVSSNPIVSVNNSTICNGQPATLTASGASSYLWNTGNTSSSITVSPSITTTYFVTGSNFGCTASSTGIVTVNPLPNAQISSSSASCSNTDGNATATGGTSYLWSNGATSATITGLIPGDYIVTVTNAAGCFSSTSVNIPEIPIINATASSTNETCSFANGTVTANVTGTCTPDFSYIWNTLPAQTSQTVINLPAGTYTVTVTCNGCTTTATTTIISITGPSVTMSNIIGATCHNADGSASASVTGGTVPYSYTWNCNPQQHTQNMINVVAGSYIVTVTDSNGCIATATALIPGTQIPTATISTTNEICDRVNGTATVTASGGSGTYTYLWNTNPPQTSATITGLSAGLYTVTIDDGICPITVNAQINNIPGPDAHFSAHPKILTSMGGTVYFSDNSSGNIVNWLWNFGDGSPNGSSEELNHDYNIIGTYLVTLIVTDNNGCIDSVSDTIKVKEIFTFYVPSAFTPNGDEVDDYFFPKGINWDPDNFEMYIFDRWGNLVYQTKTIGDKWNGTINNNGIQENLQMDVFIYLIKVKEMDGPSHEYIGRITLLL